MSLVEILRVIGGGLLLFLPGFLLTYIFFRGKEISLIERIPLSSCLSISLITLILFFVNKVFGVKIDLLTCTATICIITIAVVLVLLKSKSFRLSSFFSTTNFQHNNIWQYFGLSLILAFAFFMAFIPHLNYIYPLHIDEWYHFGWSQALTQTQTIAFAEPFFGEVTVFDHHEIGFHLFLSEIKLLTGLSWINVFLIFPSLIFVLTALTAFTIGQRANFGLEAAFFVTLIPTTVRFLGPSFLVPVSLGLFFLAAILFLLHCCEINKLKAVVLFLLIAFIFLCHPPTAIAASLLCLIYGFISLWENHGDGTARWQTPLIIWGTAIISSIIFLSRYPLLATKLTAQIPQPESYSPLIHDALPKFGFIPLGLFVVGIGFLMFEKRRKAWGIIASSGALLAIILSYQVLNVGVFILYERSYLYFFLLAGIIAGFASHRLKWWCSDFFTKFTKRATLLSFIPILMLVIAAGLLNIRSHLSEPYYHLITESQYNDCLWIREELDSSYERALVNPRTAIAFSPLAGRFIYASDAAIIFWHSERLKEVDDFLQGNISDTSWLIERNIYVLYTELPVDSPELIKLKEGIYIVPKGLHHEKSP